MAYGRVTQSVVYVIGQEGTPSRITQSIVYVVGKDSDSGGGNGGDGDSCPESILFGGLKRQALTMLGEDPSAPIYWTSDEIGRYVNDVYSDVCLDTKAVEMIEAVFLNGATATTSDMVAQVFRVTFEDKRLLNITKIEMDKSGYDWENETGLVTHYITNQQDHHTLRVFKEWDGTAYPTLNQFFDDGAYTYSAWVLGNTIAVGDRVTNDWPSLTGNTAGYVCTTAHTATAATEPGVGVSWETYWSPLCLVVWATKNPPLMTADDDEPELPPWSHLGLAFGAAAKALKKYGEQRNDICASAYQAMADSYWKMLKGLIGNRSTEQTMMMSSMGGQRTRGVRPYPWPPLVVP